MDKKIPAHVSIIMDGNGRWAQAQGKERIYGHMHGVESVRAVLTTCAEEGVKYLSLYAFSEENWNRPTKEVEYLMGLMMESMLKEVDGFMSNGVRFLVRGNLGRISDSLRKTIKEIEDRTAANTTITLIIFLSYSGQWDILQAAKRIAADHPEGLDNLTAEDFSHYLVTDGIPDPDLIIRTSGEQRISNYLLWQGAYSEFYFTDVLWPDFRKEECLKALEEYSRRDRRYGKVK